MARMYELRQKEIINIKDGGRFGFLTDVEIDHESGGITSLIVPGPGKMFGMFRPEQEYRIPWDTVRQIGEDIILIECDTNEVLNDIE